MMAKRHPIVDMTALHISKMISHRISELMVNHKTRLATHQLAWVMS
jgi:hypothetical protein